MGLPLLTDNCEQKLDYRDVGRSRCPQSWHGGETEPRGVWRGTPTTYRDGNTNVSFITEECSGDTPMARWAGEGNDWIKLMAQKNREEDVIPSLLPSVKQTVEKKAETHRDQGDKEAEGLAPSLNLKKLEAGQRPTLEFRGDCTTIVDWINGHPKLKTRECTAEKTQNLLRARWGPGVHLRQRTADCDTHVFREHNKEATLWADKGAKGRVDEWVDIARVVWSEVVVLAGSLSARNAGRFRVKGPWKLSWRGCGTLTDNMCQWIDQCVR